MAETTSFEVLEILCAVRGVQETDWGVKWR